MHATALKMLPSDRVDQNGKKPCRRYQRVTLALEGRCLHDGQEYPVRTVDISCGGARIEAPFQPPQGALLVCYLDNLDRIECRVVRHVNRGFGVAFDITSHKRAKLADRLVWLVNQDKYGLSNERMSIRKPGDGPAIVTCVDGRKLKCRVLDISLTGAAFESDERLPFIGEHMSVGHLRGEVVRVAPKVFAIRFLYGAH